MCDVSKVIPWCDVVPVFLVPLEPAGPIVPAGRHRIQLLLARIQNDDNIVTSETMQQAKK
jgi:hypothetical protein